MKAEIPPQFEFIGNFVQNTKVTLTGQNLSGDIDFMYANPITLYPTDEELKSVLLFNTSIVVTDTSSNIIEAESELVVNLYKYEHNLDIEEVYGIFCYATIFNYMTISNAVREKGIMHNGEFYKPTVIVPTFEKIKDSIVKARNSAYGLS